MPTLRRDHDLFSLQSNKLLSLSRSLGLLPAQHQKLVAEIVLLRLFGLLENSLESICAKLCSGASYVDGTVPSVRAQQRSKSAAVHAMEVLGRSNPRRARWNDGADIRGSRPRLTRSIYGTACKRPNW